MCLSQYSTYVCECECVCVCVCKSIRYLSVVFSPVRVIALSLKACWGCLSFGGHEKSCVRVCSRCAEALTLLSNRSVPLSLSLFVSLSLSISVTFDFLVVFCTCVLRCVCDCVPLCERECAGGGRRCRLSLCECLTFCVCVCFGVL